MFSVSQIVCYSLIKCHRWALEEEFSHNGWKKLHFPSCTSNNTPPSYQNALWEGEACVNHFSCRWHRMFWSSVWSFGERWSVCSHCISQYLRNISLQCFVEIYLVSFLCFGAFFAPFSSTTQSPFWCAFL